MEVGIMAKSSVPKSPKVCQVEDCIRKYKAKGFCDLHYGQMHKWNEIRPQKKYATICSVNGCNREFRAKGYCLRHYQQMLRHGMISGNPEKLKYGETNRYIFNGDECHIELYDKEGNINNYAIIDSEDYCKVKDIKWSIGGRGYVSCGRRNGVNFKLHRVVLGLSPNDENPDHIDGNPLDNRKLNLRQCTQQQNTYNSKLSKNNTSGCKGVSWDKSKSKWSAKIKHNYKSIHLGRFKDKEKAVRAYDIAAIKVFGEFANINGALNMGCQAHDHTKYTGALRRTKEANP